MVINDSMRLLDVIKEAQDLCPIQGWWRGQAVSTWELVPHVYRGNRTPLSEMGGVHYFRSKAPARYENCPTNEVDWLFLMQHHGLPTRLLDWTESPLIALYFAVCQPEYDSQSGTLWMLNGVELNVDRFPDNPGIITAPGEDKEAARIATEAFTGIQRDTTDHILAMQPPHTDIRMLVQQSVSTIHATTIPLDKLNNSEEFLWKIEILSDQKESLRNMLGALGIHESVLFPDLDHLAKGLLLDWIDM